MRKKSLTKDQREIQIIQWFRERVMKDNYDTASLAQIARGLGMSPSSHLRSICERLVDDKTLKPAEFKRSGRWIGRGYRPNKTAFRRPKRALVINFTLKGETHKEVLEL